MSVRLTLRRAPAAPTDAASIRPDAFLELDEVAIAGLPMGPDPESPRIGDLFDVLGGRSDDVRVNGDLTRLRGLGADMTGGTLRLEGDAADGVGAGMRGGLILVHGSVGDEAGARMRRGSIAVTGRAGQRAGLQMIAGTLLVLGDLGRAPGFGLKRGTLVAGGSLELLPTFRLACTYRPGILPLLFRSLRRHGFEAGSRLEGGAFRRWIGDCADLGRGEILHGAPP